MRNGGMHEQPYSSVQASSPVTNTKVQPFNTTLQPFDTSLLSTLSTQADPQLDHT